MEFVISDNVTVWQKYTMFDLQLGFDELTQEQMLARMLGDNPTRIRIKDTWYDAIPIYRAARATSKVDGKYHFLYIQINMGTNEYYVGKANRKNWKELKRYQGSGLKFKYKYKGHETEYVRYFIACCETAKETEEMEAAIVDSELLKDPKCLNLVQGGAGTNEHYDYEKRASHQSEYMKEHPEQYKAMVEKAKQIYLSGDSPQLKQRSEAIKKTMNEEQYKVMTSERIRRWKENDPEGYKKARENNKKAMSRPEVKEKKRKAREKWVAEHPDEYKAIQEKSMKARNTPEALQKRKESLKAWAENNPAKARENLKKRSEASVAKCSKAVAMCDLETGEIIRTFASQHDAARWLVDNGIAKNTNCVSSINSVCQKKPCSTGYGYRKKAYGYGWEYVNSDSKSSK